MNARCGWSGKKNAGIKNYPILAGFSLQSRHRTARHILVPLLNMLVRLKPDAISRHIAARQHMVAFC
jgi:hypothetical protein